MFALGRMGWSWICESGFIWPIEANIHVHRFSRGVELTFFKVNLDNLNDLAFSFHIRVCEVCCLDAAAPRKPVHFDPRPITVAQNVHRIKLAKNCSNFQLAVVLTEARQMKFLLHENQLAPQKLSAKYRDTQQRVIHSSNRLFGSGP
jgi:hypothetical protein